MTEYDVKLEKHMAQMCIEHPGYLDWEPDVLRIHAEWQMSVREQMQDDITYKQKGYV